MDEMDMSQRTFFSEKPQATLACGFYVVPLVHPTR